MRTDTQRLDYVLTIVEQQDEEAADKLGAAYTLGFRGRVMVDAAMGARIIEPGQPMPELTALDLVGAELGRIRNVKGFSEERDDGYTNEELADAAACYLAPGGTAWPWPGYDGSDFKPCPDDRKKELTKGIALAVCELERLIRAERREDEARAEADLETQVQVCAEMNAAACESEDVHVVESDYDTRKDVFIPIEIGVPKAREFKVGDRVKYSGAGYVGLPAPTLGTVENDHGTGCLVRIDGYVRSTLYYGYAELEHVDG